MKSQTTNIGTVITTHRITWNPRNKWEATILRLLERASDDRGGAAWLKKRIILGHALALKEEKDDGNGH